MIIVTYSRAEFGCGYVARETFMINPVCRLLSVAIFVFVTMLSGCSIDKEDGPIEWDEERTIGKIIGFIDDSLVIVSDWRGWNQEKGTFIHDGGMSGGLGHQGLRVYNYRVQEDGPRWIDSLSNEIDDDFGYSKGQLSDSVVWGGDNVHTYSFEKTISFWHLGEKPRKMDVETRYDGCTIKVSTRRFREWKDGKIIALGEYNMDYYKKTDQCQYAILDTVERTITYKKLDDELKWVEKCDDVKARGSDVFCLYLMGEPLNFYLSKNDVIVDSLIQGEPYGWTSYTKVNFAGEMLNLGNNVCKIVKNQILCLGASIRGNLEFKSGEATISY